MRIDEAVSDAQVRACFPIILQLRPLLTENDFVERVKRQRREGYTLLYLSNESKVRAVAGFRVAESLGHGKFLYVDDLVSDEPERSKGYGGVLFDQLLATAKDLNCEELRLDCGVQRFDAHRFYIGRGMKLTTHHFVMKLQE